MSALKKAYLVSVMAILHGGKRYEVGDTIELGDEEASKVAIYLRPTPQKETPPTPPAHIDPTTQTSVNEGQKESHETPQNNPETPSMADDSTSQTTEGSSEEPPKTPEDGAQGEGSDDGQQDVPNADDDIPEGDKETVTPKEPSKSKGKKDK